MLLGVKEIANLRPLGENICASARLPLRPLTATCVTQRVTLLQRLLRLFLLLLLQLRCRHHWHRLQLRLLDGTLAERQQRVHLFVVECNKEYQGTSECQRKV